MNSLTCISFILNAYFNTSVVPLNVEDIIKDRIKTQISSQKKVEVLFNDIRCPNKGKYYLSDNVLHLEADNLVWSGSKEMHISDIIEGKKFYFNGLNLKYPQISSKTEIKKSDLKTKIKPKKKRRMNRWVALGLGALATGAVIYFANKAGSDAYSRAKSL